MQLSPLISLTYLSLVPNVKNTDKMWPFVKAMETNIKWVAVVKTSIRSLMIPEMG